LFGVPSIARPAEIIGYVLLLPSVKVRLPWEKRTNELDAEVDTRMRYREILKLYEEGMVFRFRDISVIDFADKVASQLIKKID
jgi:hypothetical protein